MEIKIEISESVFYCPKPGHDAYDNDGEEGALCLELQVAFCSLKKKKIYIYIYIERERDRQTDRQIDVQKC